MTVIVRIVLSILLLFSLAACATAPPKNPQVQARLADANRTLDGLNAQIAAFYPEMNGLIQSIDLLRKAPGWAEFEGILRYAPSLQEVLREEEVSPNVLPLLEEWSAQWNRPWQRMLSEYQGIADRCTIADARRLALVERLLAVQAKYIGASILELSSGRYSPGKEIYGVVEFLDKTRQELETYGLNDVGLY